MFETQATVAYHVNKFYNEQTLPRKSEISRSVRDVGNIVISILREVERTEPRFVSSLNEIGSRVEGLEVISPTEYQLVLFLTQMGVFNFVEDCAQPGCAVLKLSDGRKRSMSLWVEFITASGYLSARKVRSRFQSLVSQVIDKLKLKDIVKLDAEAPDVRLIVRDAIMVRITPAFKCGNLWPRGAMGFPDPDPKSRWPPVNLVSEIKYNGFNLLSKETPIVRGKHNTSDSDAWVMSFTNAEDKLIGVESRKKCLSILKTLRDRHLDFPGSPLNNYHMKTLLLYECEKHQQENDWNAKAIGDRVQGILLQLVSCLRCRRLPNYFVPTVDLFAGATAECLDHTVKQVWCLAREIITNSKGFDNL